MRTVLGTSPTAGEALVQIEVEAVTPLRFPDGSPVRAASAVARLGDGQLIAQDDATHAAWLRDDDTVTAVRLLPPVEGLDIFDEASGTKHLKPDLEAACEVSVDGTPAVLLLGSGSSELRMRSSLVRLDGDAPQTVVTDLSPLYASVVEALGIEPDQLNMEGACAVGRTLRWFHRGMPSAGLPTASVDLDLERLLAAVSEGADPLTVTVSAARHYDLGDVQGVGLAVTDAVFLSDGVHPRQRCCRGRPQPARRRPRGGIRAGAAVGREGPRHGGPARRGRTGAEGRGPLHPRTRRLRRTRARDGGRGRPGGLLDGRAPARALVSRAEPAPRPA
jgi:hypothetical protein